MCTGYAEAFVDRCGRCGPAFHQERANHLLYTFRQISFDVLHPREFARKQTRFNSPREQLQFEALRDLYIQAYESCDRSLRYVLGIANTHAHGNADHFKAPVAAPAVTAKNGKLKTVKDLVAFDKLRSVDKRQWLAMIPEWQQHWDATLDRQLRNDIGHAAIRHDLLSGNLLRDRGDPIAYVEFLRLAHRIIHPLVASLNVLKILRVYASMESSFGPPPRP